MRHYLLMVGKKKVKIKFLPNKWPAQERTVPIASPPKGMWYDPKVKEGKGTPQNKPPTVSLNDAVRYYIDNPDKYGMPASFDLKTQTVLFASGKTISFKEILDNYSKDSGKYKEGDASSQWGRDGFWDSPNPSDLGKEPSGDFPSVQWMPRGTEDMSVDEDIITGGLGLSEFDKIAENEYLTQEQKDQIAAQYGPEYISALSHYFDALSNGHPEDRAQEYAIKEMEKSRQTILPGTLSEVSEMYMSGT